MAATFTQMGDKYLMAQQHAKADACYAMAAKHMNMNQDDRQKFIESITGGEQVDPAYVKQLEAQVQELTQGMTAAQVAVMIEEAKKIAKEGIKVEAETALTQAKIPTERATVQQKTAAATKALEEAQAIDTETKFSKANPKEVFGKPEKPQPNGAS